MRRTLTFSLSLLMLSGCAANKMGVTPSQNTDLQAISPSTTAASEGGAMQRSLDSWLKEEWTPMSTTAPAVKTTATASNGTVVTTTEQVLVEPEDKTPFTLQKYADKWKVYHENKAKMNEGKPKEPSNIEKISNLPVIGK